ncbi:MAG: rane dipeptidase [Solirubrobacterales bacterium]|nr:rane dipeptidase [Solirubrobacterales bacterium]
MPPAPLPVFDGHNDVLTRPDHAGIRAGRDGGHVDLPRMRAGHLRGGIFAIFSAAPDMTMTPTRQPDGSLAVPYPGRLDRRDAAAHATAVAGRLLALERAGAVRLGRTAEDLDAAFDGGPPVAVMGLEGAEAIDEGLEALDTWYGAGLRVLGPVWSRPNAFASGVPFVFPSSPDTGPGLTDAGRGLVRRCAELGVLVDLSHLNEAGFWDVAALEAGPLVASHSGVHALCPASRNLTDRQLDAIGATDGLVGIVYANKFLRADFADADDTPLARIVEHARYVRDRIGIAHVALGSDFDGASVPAALGDVAGLPRLLDAFRAGGFDEDELAAVAWGNWRRVLGAWWDGAR